jgi:hypothetical protein
VRREDTTGMAENPLAKKVGATLAVDEDEDKLLRNQEI